ncbi:GNAT family N-acetyltransferase [Halobacteriovorax sp. GB3]|uniref:GNAT family N-acetyltransferase n=1 Tax=Halobacteriovorax sp. GB3 TaxID=2719615 RepID=UPI00235F2F11|nr:GNAT family N-acetyltransferase [Halobacteriovorax sp. GB3]MDD0852771.1 GNAT family N-acetyltransferase [Halobacteriovorax sp. GB3]
MKFKIATNKDLKNLKEIYRLSALHIGRKLYDEKQVHMWSSFSEKDDFEEFVLKGRVEIAFLKTRPAGFLGLHDDGYLSSLYVHPDFEGNKVASHLLKRAITYARDLNLKEISCDASLLSEPVFSHFGFKVVKREIVERDGVFFDRAQMKLLL